MKRSSRSFGVNSANVTVPLREIQQLIENGGEFEEALAMLNAAYGRSDEDTGSNHPLPNKVQQHRRNAR
jgi:hypothetical protein